MGIAAPQLVVPSILSQNSKSTTMSQDYHQDAAVAAGGGIFSSSFSNGFDRSPSAMSHQEHHHHQQQQQHLAQQIRRDKLRSVRGFEPQQPPPLVGIEEEEESSGLPVYETAQGMLSDIFNFPSGVAGVTASKELLDQQQQTLQPNYRTHRELPSSNTTNQWYNNLGDLDDESKSSTTQNNRFSSSSPSSAVAKH